LESISPLNLPIIQYRNKFDPLNQIEADLQLIRKHYHGKIIINDHISLIDYADGIHLGQEDIEAIAVDRKEAIEIIREKIGDKIVGISTHNIEEVEEANTLAIDYIGLGAYRHTDTKQDANVAGDELLEIAKLSTHPVAIIGGVRLDDKFGDEISYRVVGSGLYDR
jgi:thiamine-phosphate pyrophosphorylase